MNIVDILEVEKPKVNTEYADKLESAGLTAASFICRNKYPIITQTAVTQFLKNIARQYRDGEWYCDPDDALDRGSWNEVLFLATKEKLWYQEHDYSRMRVSWDEQPLSEYRGTPPMHVLKSAEEAKTKFDQLRVVTIGCVRVEDPLLIGIKEGISDRFLIDWWGNDIDPTQIESV